jgi:hypothetical protein
VTGTRRVVVGLSLLSALGVSGSPQQGPGAFDLARAQAQAAVLLVNPASPMGQLVRESVVREQLAAAFDTDRGLGTPNHIRILRRDWWEPIPID